MEYLVILAVLATLFDAMNKKNKQKRQRAELEEVERREAQGDTPSAVAERAATKGTTGRSDGAPPSVASVPVETRPRSRTEVAEDPDAVRLMLKQLGLGVEPPGLETPTVPPPSSRQDTAPRPPGRRGSGGRGVPAYRGASEHGGGSASSARQRVPERHKAAPASRDVAPPDFRAPAATERRDRQPTSVRTRRPVAAEATSVARRDHPLHRRSRGYGTAPSTRAPSRWGLKAEKRSPGSDVRAMLAGSDSRSLRNAIILREVFGPPAGTRKDPADPRS